MFDEHEHYEFIHLSQTRWSIEHTHMQTIILSRLKNLSIELQLQRLSHHVKMANYHRVKTPTTHPRHSS